MGQKWTKRRKTGGINWKQMEIDGSRQKESETTKENEYNWKEKNR